jgi:ribonucleotide reductase beta subunit family protein with ferritin-like domain
VDRPVWDMYTKARRLFWSADDINVSTDKKQMYNVLTKAEQHAVKYIHAFFASADGVININIVDRFKEDYKDSLEINYFYDFQVMIENIHAEVYSMILFELVPDSIERNQLLNGFNEIPVVKRICSFLFKYIREDVPLSHRLLAMICAEGILFTGCFAIIYWLSDRGLMPGLAHANELISRDEALHTYFGILLLRREGIDSTIAHTIVDEATQIGIDFMKETIIEDMQAMNIRLIVDYIKHSADNILGLIEQPLFYNVKHSLYYMDKINMANKTAFFERRVSEYSKSEKTNDAEFELTEDF